MPSVLISENNLNTFTVFKAKMKPRPKIGLLLAVIVLVYGCIAIAYRDTAASGTMFKPSTKSFGTGNK